MDFQEAQARFQWLEGQFQAGGINAPQYQAALNDLRVTDAWGRLWMLQEHSGIWHVFHNGAWVAAQPPVQPVAAPPPPVQQAPYAYPVYPAAQPAAQFIPGVEKKESSLLFRYVRFFFIWLAIWVLIAAGVWIFYGSTHESEWKEILPGIGVAAGLSLILLLWSLRGSWKGQVVEIRVVQEKSYDEDGGVDYQDVRYAFIRQTNGKMRKEQALPAWQQGDWLEKKQGENWVRKLG